MGRQFTALRVIGTIFKVLAWLALILGVLAAIGVLVASFTLEDQITIPGLGMAGPLTGIAVFFVALLVSIIYFLLLYAVGETIYLVLAIEENTRRSAWLLQQQYAPVDTSYAARPGTPGYTE